MAQSFLDMFAIANENAKPSRLPINRPYKSWDRPLSDPGWRRWFDIIKEQGVDKMADASIGARRGMFRPSVFSLLNEDQGRSF